jgi:hypothetical protein
MRQITGLGLKLKGIIHSAGVTNDKAIAKSTWADFESVLACKLQGSLNLHEATKDMALDFFVMYSSVSGLLGNMGQANYAAANAFLDGLCVARHSQGLPALSISWGPWGSVGMAANMENAEAMGLKKEMLIGSDDGMRMLELAITQGKPHYAITPSAFLSLFAAGSSKVTSDLLKELRGEKKAAASKPAPKAKKSAKHAKGKKAPKEAKAPKGEKSLLSTLAAATKGMRSKLIQEFICAEIARVLSLDASKVNVRKPFNDMGFGNIPHSLPFLPY